MNKRNQKRVHILFPLEQDDQGYPGIATERMWAKRLGDQLYQIDNIPFYAKGISLGDVVFARDKDGILFFDGIHRTSGNTTVRIVFFPDKTSEPEIANLLKELEDLGTTWEGGTAKTQYSINVPSHLDYTKVQNLLHHWFQTGKLDYEESALAHEL